MNDQNSSFSEKARAHAGLGLHASAKKVLELGANPPTSKGSAAVFAAKVALAGGKEYAKAMGNAGLAFVEGVAKQYPSPGAALNKKNTNQLISQGGQASRALKGVGNNPQNKTSGQTSNVLKGRSTSSGTSQGSGASNGPAGGSVKGGQRR